MRSVLIARLQDSEVAVIEALYEDPLVVTPIFCEDPTSFVASLCLAFASQAKSKRNITKLHLLYLATHFLPAVAEPSIQNEIFHQILFPFLLFTKSRQKMAELVWDLVGRFPKATESSALNWLDGCDSLVKTEMLKAEHTDAVELMNQINFSFSSKIAGELNPAS